MHQKRQEASKMLPIRRKGTKYVAKALQNPKYSVPVVIAVRDMLHLARNASEVRKMIVQKALKINGRVVKDYRDAISLLNLFEADKTYVLTLLPTKKFVLKETKDKERVCKVTGKRLLGKNTIQLNLHDGTNFLVKDSSIKVNDSVLLQDNKFKSHIPLVKGEEVFIFKGKYTGNVGKILEINDVAEIKLKDSSVQLNKINLIAI